MLRDQSEPTVVSEEQSKLENASGKKIFFSILGGCLAAFLIVGLIITGLIWWATPKVKKELEKNKPKIEEWAKELEKQAREVEEQKVKEQNGNAELPIDNVNETNLPTVIE